MTDRQVGGLQLAALFIALAIAMHGCSMRSGLKIQACSNNPYLTVCGDLVKDVPR